MAQIFAGRYTAHTDGSYVVFLIGMRFNRLLAVRRWSQVFMAMPPMLRTLAEHPEKGCLGSNFWFNWRSLMLVQYWRSFEDLERFARDRDDPHLAAWQRFNQQIGADGSVGIWHETYKVAAGASEALYGNMPRTGLAAAMEHVPVGAGRGVARERMRAAGGEA